MLKYYLAASALKVFSSCQPARALYRKMANTVGTRQRSREPMPAYYAERATRLLSAFQKHPILRDGNRILEIGTGWIHWESISCRVLFDVEAILFDVWDNRQFAALKIYVANLDRHLRSEATLTPAQRAHVTTWIERILETKSFDELYRVLGFRYVVEPYGDLRAIESHSVDLIISANVLEHIKREHVPKLLRQFRRILKPGGYSMHHINFGDHLRPYDIGVHKKNYLSYSDRVWKLLFENQVQYINRMQRSEWLAAFDRTEFSLCDEQSESVSLAGLKVNKRFGGYDTRDLECFCIDVLHQTAPTLR